MSRYSNRKITYSLLTNKTSGQKILRAAAEAEAYAAYGEGWRSLSGETAGKPAGTSGQNGREGSPNGYWQPTRCSIRAWSTGGVCMKHAPCLHAVCSMHTEQKSVRQAGRKMKKSAGTRRRRRTINIQETEITVVRHAVPIRSGRLSYSFRPARASRSSWRQSARR